MNPDASGSEPSVTIVVHAATKPEGERLDAVRKVLADAFSDAEVIEAFESEAAIGEAALVHRAMSHAHGDVLVVLQPSIDWKRDDLRAIVAAIGDGLALGIVDGASHDQAGRPKGLPHRSTKDLSENRNPVAPGSTSAAGSRPAAGSSPTAGSAPLATDASPAAPSTFSPVAADLNSMTRTLSPVEAGLPPSHESFGETRRSLGAIDPGPVVAGLPPSLERFGATRRSLGGGGQACNGLDKEQERALLDVLREGDEFEGWRRLLAPDPPLWAINRSLYKRLGGLDERLWSIGIVRDLEARVRAVGATVREVQMRGEFVGSAPYPVEPTLARALAWRNALVTAFKTLPPDALGVALATITADAITASWRAAGIEAPLLQFGGSWGTRSNPLRPSDPVGTLVPLLAVDSFLTQITALEAERHALRIPATASSEAQTAARAPIDLQPGSPPAPGLEARDITPSEKPAPTVSVIVVNWNGKAHLRECFQSLLASTYPKDRLELICVDNGSTDGSQALLKQEFPSVIVVALDQNRGFTGGNEAGVSIARGDVLLFLNNDMRVDADAVTRLVQALDDDHACAAARVLSWDGRRIDFIQGTLNFEARGFQERFGERVRPETSVAPDTFFPNGGAFAVTRAAYDACGGFDPDFFAYYDDVDLGWRLRLVGVVPRVVPEAVVYHRHGATSSQHPRGHKRFLMERNALWTALKNYDRSSLRRVLAPILLLAVRRITQDVRVPRSSAIAGQYSPLINSTARSSSGISTTPWKLVYSRPKGLPPPILSVNTGIIAIAMESLAALGAGLEALPRLVVARDKIQARRLLPDAEVLSRFGRALEYNSSRASYMNIQDTLVNALDVPPLLRGRSRVVIITHEPLRKNISGPGVRALEMGRALGQTLRVTIAAPGDAELTPSECVVAPYRFEDHASLRRIAEQADVLVVRGFTLAQFPFLRDMHVPIAVDLYCPFTLEHLEMNASNGGVESETFQQEASNILAIQNEQLGDGDFFICASERQRDFWIGTLHGAGRINPQTYAADPTLRHLIDVVPFGLPDESFEHAVARSAKGGRVLKGVRPGVGLTDRVLLWGGSILDWQDPVLLVRAVAELSHTRSDVKLFFMGTKHPNPQVKPARAVAASIETARELNVLDQYVFFNDWVPYEERAAYLAEADLGLSTHTDHLETRYSFRTRMLDYIWASLPIVCTDGDHFGAMVRERGLGLTVPPGDARALAAAIARLLDAEEQRRECVRHLAQVAHELRWSRVVEPLGQFLNDPTFAPDRAPAVQAMRKRLAQSYRMTKWLKRTALSMGVGEGTIEQLKETAAVRAVMAVRNKLALARVKRAKT